MTTYGYTRVSTEEQARTGYGLDAQRKVIAQEASRRGWTPTYVADDGVSASIPPSERPALGPLLAAIRPGDTLCCAKLDRLARSTLDFANLMARAKAERWTLVLLDLGVDMSTPMGKFVADIMAAVAELERQMISARTRDALAAAKARGVRLGRTRRTLDSVMARALAAREQGDSYAAIARTFNAEQVPTAHGGKCWYPATVRGLVRSAALDEEAA